MNSIVENSETRTKIQWSDKESKSLWLANMAFWKPNDSLRQGKEDFLENDLCSEKFIKMWNDIIIATENFAKNVQDQMSKNTDVFGDIVEKALKNLLLDNAQINRVISNLVWGWVFGEELRIWNNARYGYDSSFRGLAFS